MTSEGSCDIRIRRRGVTTGKARWVSENHKQTGDIFAGPSIRNMPQVASRSSVEHCVRELRGREDPLRGYEFAIAHVVKATSAPRDTLPCNIRDRRTKKLTQSRSVILAEDDRFILSRAPKQSIIQVKRSNGTNCHLPFCISVPMAPRSGLTLPMQHNLAEFFARRIYCSDELPLPG